MDNCIFCQIAKKEKEAEIILENEKFSAFRDINPKAPIHILIVPKEHIISVNHLKEEDKMLIGELFLFAQEVAERVRVKDKGYKLVFNVGKGGGQLINHLHLHLLGGWQRPEERDIPGMP